MAFADTSVRTVLAAGPYEPATLAEACGEGDPLAYDSGWYLADANASRPATHIALDPGAVGDTINIAQTAKITGFSGGTAGDPLYLSDTAGKYDDSAGTVQQYVGVMADDETAWIHPLPQGQIGSPDIAAGAVVNSDVNASAGIAFTKLAALADGKLLVGNGSNVATAVDMSGDATIANDGAVTIGEGVVETAMLEADAIDGDHLADEAVDSEHYVDGSIDAEHLSTTLKTGTINLDITTAREIASNNIQNLAAHGGLLASDSVPALRRANGATDKALCLDWANTEVDEIQFGPIAKPADLDADSDVEVHVLGKMAGSTDDATTIDCQFYDGEGDTEAGASTATALTTSLAEHVATIPHAGIAAAPGVMNFGLVPSAHDTDDLYVYAVWLEYTRA